MRNVENWDHFTCQFTQELAEYSKKHCKNIPVVTKKWKTNFSFKYGKIQFNGQGQFEQLATNLDLHQANFSSLVFKSQENRRLVCYLPSTCVDKYALQHFRNVTVTTCGQVISSSIVPTALSRKTTGIVENLATILPNVTFKVFNMHSSDSIAFESDIVQCLSMIDNDIDTSCENFMAVYWNVESKERFFLLEEEFANLEHKLVRIETVPNNGGCIDDEALQLSDTPYLYPYCLESHCDNKRLIISHSSNNQICSTSSSGSKIKYFEGSSSCNSVTGIITSLAVASSVQCTSLEKLVEKASSTRHKFITPFIASAIAPPHC